MHDLLTVEKLQKAMHVPIKKIKYHDSQDEKKIRVVEEAAPEKKSNER